MYFPQIKLDPNVDDARRESFAVSASSMPKKYRERYNWHKNHLRDAKCPYCGRTGTMTICSEVIEESSWYIMKDGSTKDKKYRYYVYFKCKGTHASSWDGANVMTRVSCAHLTDEYSWKTIDLSHDEAHRINLKLQEPTAYYRRRSK